MGAYKEAFRLMRKRAAEDYTGKYDNIGGGDIALGLVKDTIMAPVNFQRRIGDLAFEGAKTAYNGAKDAVVKGFRWITGRKKPIPEGSVEGEYNEDVQNSGAGAAISPTELAMERKKRGLAAKPTPYAMRQ